MLTVPEAARRVGRNPETVRRWIRSGRLPARKVGTQHVIEEADLDAMFDDDVPAPVPEEWGWDRTFEGRPMPNVIALLREVRGER
jgi:excisionase family DNA binding protein